VYSFSTIQNLQEDLKSGAVTCKILVQEAILAIDQKKQLNAFLEVYDKTAFQQAIV
jgi:Asp-tRNA(Asn)/Glu-tRNA(Gln) amidotransferase A subunit family amidase